MAPAIERASPYRDERPRGVLSANMERYGVSAEVLSSGGPKAGRVGRGSNVGRRMSSSCECRSGSKSRLWREPSRDGDQRDCRAEDRTDGKRAEQTQPMTLRGGTGLGESHGAPIGNSRIGRLDGKFGSLWA